MTYVAIASLLIVNTLALALVPIGLPGTWLMVGATAAVAWLRSDDEIVGTSVLITIAGIAAAAEVVEFLSAMAGAKKAGGSRWGSVGAIVGAIAGGLLGTVWIPVPIVGSILGVCIGAFAGASALEFVSGRPLAGSLETGRGAAVGRLVGVVIKLFAGLAIWSIVAVAAFV